MVDHTQRRHKTDKCIILLITPTSVVELMINILLWKRFQVLTELIGGVLLIFSCNLKLIVYSAFSTQECQADNFTDW